MILVLFARSTMARPEASGDATRPSFFGTRRSRQSHLASLVAIFHRRLEPYLQTRLQRNANRRMGQ